jgi:hypothetical protein
MPRELPSETERRKVMAIAFNKASERAKDSPHGMRQTARALRENAARMPDSRDRDMMLRLAAGYERRAKNADSN